MHTFVLGESVKGKSKFVGKDVTRVGHVAKDIDDMPPGHNFPRDYFETCTIMWRDLIENVHIDQWTRWKISKKNCSVRTENYAWAETIEAAEDLGITWRKGAAFNVCGVHYPDWVGIYIPENRMEELRAEMNRRAGIK